MGRFLIISVIKEHNADGYQNYDKWHKLLYIRPIHGYYIVLPIEQQFWNFTNLDVWKENVYIQTEEILLFNLRGGHFSETRFGKGYFWPSLSNPCLVPTLLQPSHIL